jgi:tetratricopeptide (TPR) repeat protein
MGAYEEAASFYERAMAVHDEALGPEHPDVAMILYELARTHVETRAYEEAKACYERALAIWEKAPGHDHAYEADAATGLAEVEARLASAEAGARRPIERGATAASKPISPEGSLEQAAEKRMRHASSPMRPARCPCAVPIDALERNRHCRAP